MTTSRRQVAVLIAFVIGLTMVIAGCGGGSSSSSSSSAEEPAESGASPSTAPEETGSPSDTKLSGKPYIIGYW